MIAKTRILGLACIAALSALQAGESDWAPYSVQWPARPDSPADVSGLLRAPAGKDGFVVVRNGHLAEPNGERLKLWGVNLSMRAGMPPKQDAPIIAANLARLGVNGARFHFIDIPAPSGLIVSDREDTQWLDPDQLDRLDFLIAQFKRRGIYSNLNLNVGRRYKPGDGAADHELLGMAKSLTYFNERLIELQKDYARRLLTHRNPYTASEYREEPAVALVEMVNENSLIEAWFGGRLLGTNTRRDPGTWSDIPARYAEELTALYNAWLKERFSETTLDRWRREAGQSAGNPLPRLAPQEFSKASEDRFHAEAMFYLDVERRFFTEMRRYLKEDLGVQSLLIGNSDHGHHKTGYPQLLGTSLLDVVDGHVYWQHPNYINDPKTGKRNGFRIPNTPMVDDPLHSTVVQLSRSAVAGKPFTVSEVNHPFPHEFAAEGIPILAAYASLQDWDGVFWYTLAHRELVDAAPKVSGHFDLAQDPIKMCQLAAGALMFLRGDVRRARDAFERNYTPRQVRESIRLPYSERPFFTPGFPLGLPLRQAVRIGSFEGPATAVFPEPLEFPVRSDTGELAWHWNGERTGWVAVDTPRSQALIGFLDGEDRSAGRLAVELKNRFAAVTLSSLDDRPIASSSKLLLTASSRMANQRMQWNDDRASLEDWGEPPTVIEPVLGVLILRGLIDADEILLLPLDGAGRYMEERIPAERKGEDWRAALGDPPTPWHVLEVTR